MNKKELTPEQELIMLERVAKFYSNENAGIEDKLSSAYIFKVVNLMNRKPELKGKFDEISKRIEKEKEEDAKREENKDGGISEKGGGVR